MKREKWVEYDACDFCDSTMEAVGCCDICGKHYCPAHGQHYPYGDQIYTFCDAHYEQAIAILTNTGIPLGFIEYKLRGREFNQYMLYMWSERGYEKKWNDFMEVNRNG